MRTETTDGLGEGGLLSYSISKAVTYQGRNYALQSRSPHVRESKTVLDSGFHAMDSGFSLLDLKSFSVDLGFRIPIVSGILDSYSCIPDSKAQDSGFHKQNFLIFRILQAKISGIPESGFPYMGRSRRHTRNLYIQGRERRRVRDLT